MGADQNLDIHLEYAPAYDYAGLAAVVNNARTPSFVLRLFFQRFCVKKWVSKWFGTRLRKACDALREQNRIMFLIGVKAMQVGAAFEFAEYVMNCFWIL